MFKKLLIAESLGSYADSAFAAAALHFLDTPSAWRGVLAYTLQIYFDFSAYCDMAIGVSRIFNIQLPANFESPYKSRSIKEFWRRWHMTLSRFLRDYLYIPLGGNRAGPARRYANLCVTMVLGGLWHGAGWTFIIWGALHGFYLCVNHAWDAMTARLGPMPLRWAWLGSLLAWGITFVAVIVAWVFFGDVFAQRTGLITGAFHRDDVPASAYLASKVFKATPPRLLIYEIVEREMDRVSAAGTRCPAEVAPPGPVFKLRPAAMDRFPVARSRDTSASFSTAQIDTAVDVMIKQATRWLIGRDWTDVLQLPMSKTGLFSSRRSDRLLIYKGDLRKAQIGPVQEAQLACYFRNLQSQVEANGRTAFLLMVVPDKSTIYAAYTALPALPNMVERLADDPLLHTMRLDKALQDAVAHGRQDVYLPSDTHWGWAGKEIAADALVSRLLQ